MICQRSSHPQILVTSQTAWDFIMQFDFNIVIDHQILGFLDLRSPESGHKSNCMGFYHAV
jgi:hypothetical protein